MIRGLAWARRSLRAGILIAALGLGGCVYPPEGNLADLVGDGACGVFYACNGDENRNGERRNGEGRSGGAENPPPQQTAPARAPTEPSAPDAPTPE